MKSDNRFYLFLSLLIAETFVIFWFSFAPSVDFVQTGIFRPGDFEHFIAYSFYGFFLFAVLRRFTGRKGALFFSIILGSVVGGMSEGVQFLLPYRIGDVIDLAFDACGSSAGACLGSKFKTLSQ